MTWPGIQAETASAPFASLRRLLACIRLDEVAVLQGAPVLGACLAMIDISAATLLDCAGLIAGNLCLVAHVFVLNDWAGIQGDLKDPHRATRNFVAQGESAARMAYLASALLIASLLIFALIGQTVVIIALAIAALSALYSLPGIHGKGVPLLSSLLHLVGGTLHFLLGYTALSTMSWHGAAIGCYFGLVFAAGHLTHEARDHGSDRLNGIRTNAVAFGQKKAFIAGMALFALAYAMLPALALLGLVPKVLSWAVVLYLFHLGAAWRTLKNGLTYRGIRELQTVYRNIHIVIGMVMSATAVPW